MTTMSFRPAEEPVRPVPASVQDRMIGQLSARGYILLQTVGRLADEAGLSAYAVGGLVRDLLRGRASTDLDVVVEGDAVAFAGLLARELDGTVRAHHAFGTAAVALPDDLALDVATARAEAYDRPAALPRVTPASIMQDLFRRDFTVNAMAIRLNARRFGELIDPFGGQEDVRAKRLRTLHTHSFLDDPTRLFRVVRFETRLGFRMDGDTLAQCRDAVRQRIPERLSSHRLLNELRLLLSDAQPRAGAARLGALALLQFVHPNLAWTAGSEKLFEAVRTTLNQFRRAADPSPHPEAWHIYLMALMEGLSLRAVREAAKRLGLPARDAEQMAAARGTASAVLRRLAKRPPPKPSAIFHLLAGLADETVLFLAARAASGAVKRRLAAYRTTYRHAKPLLTGADLKALGLRPGPRYKKILDRLLAARLDGEVRTEADERKLAARLVRV
jgi:tRNA nucleotidyltransferase (CCA-adding enzyme)